MTKLLSVLFIVLTTMVFVAPANSQSVRETIEAALVKFSESFNAKDAAAVAAHYAEDAAVFPPDSARIDGRTNIQNFWKGAIEAGLSDLSLKAIEVEDQGDWAYEVGELTYSAPGTSGARSTASGKYIVVWKKDTDGTWRIYRDIWNSSPAGSK
jgi:uncharacterized protein (TIGR02246 family)